MTAARERTAKEMIGALQSRGWSIRQIAHEVGRDPSLISQVAKGKKPGENLKPALEAMLSGRPVPEPERRIRQNGELARVRLRKP